MKALKIAAYVIGAAYLLSCALVFLGMVAFAQITAWDAFWHALTWPYWFIHGV